MPDHFHDCSRCGQTTITRHLPAVCGRCRDLERAPQGEPVRLFEPAPAQLPGQLEMDAGTSTELEPWSAGLCGFEG